MTQKALEGFVIQWALNSYEQKNHRLPSGLAHASGMATIKAAENTLQLTNNLLTINIA